jgi:hypothetical protein
VGIPFTSLTLVNADHLLPLMDRLREQLPEELRQARQMLDRRDEMLSEAHGRASQMMQDAKTQAEFLLSESELMKAVRQEADQVREQLMQEMEAYRRKTFEECQSMIALSAEEARHLRESADQYAESILEALDHQVADFNQVVQTGKKQLAQSRLDARNSLESFKNGQGVPASAKNRTSNQVSSSRTAQQDVLKRSQLASQPVTGRPRR